MGDKGLPHPSGPGSLDVSDAPAATSTVSDAGRELRAWQDRCALVEAALAAANDVLHRELPQWQERCAATEEALAAATARMHRELPEWERRCAATEEALTAATDRMHRELPEWERRCAATEEALAGANRRIADEIPRWRDRCEFAERALASLEESRKGHFVAVTDTADFLAFASRFSPAEAVGSSKTRIGAAADGGYVMLDDVAAPSLALSLGVGDETSWDRRMAELGATIHQYDHTVRPPPEQPPSIVFHQTRIVDVPDGSGVTLEHALSVLDAGNSGRPAILKMDIEGSEWPVLDAAPDAVLERFDQIVCEYHDFGQAADRAWFERASRVATKLDRYFQVVHVHGNNAEPIVVVGGVPFPSVLEVTYASRSRYRFQLTQERFPTKLDCPNHPGRPDLWLGTFSFGCDGELAEPHSAG